MICSLKLDSPQKRLQLTPSCKWTPPNFPYLWLQRVDNLLTLSHHIYAAISLLLFHLKATTKPRSHACLYLLLISPGCCRGVSILPSGMRGEGDSPQLSSSFLRSSDVIKRWNGFDVSRSPREIPRNRERQRDRDTVQTAAWVYGAQTGGAGDAMSTSCPRDLAIKAQITVCVCCLLLGWYWVVRIMSLLSRWFYIKFSTKSLNHNWHKVYTLTATNRKYIFVVWVWKSFHWLQSFKTL